MSFSAPADSSASLDAAVWPSPDPMFLLGNQTGAVPLQWQAGVYDWPPSGLFDEVSARPLDSSAGGPSKAEIGQWNRFLDHVGVWE